MYFMRLLTTIVNNDKVVVRMHNYKILDNNNLKSCINKGLKEFKKANRVNKDIVGYAIYSGFTTNSKIEFHYVIEKYENLIRYIGDPN